MNNDKSKLSFFYTNISQRRNAVHCVYDMEMIICNLHCFVHIGALLYILLSLKVGRFAPTNRVGNEQRSQLAIAFVCIVSDIINTSQTLYCVQHALVWMICVTSFNSSCWYIYFKIRQ